MSLVYGRYAMNASETALTNAKQWSGQYFVGFAYRQMNNRQSRHSVDIKNTALADIKKKSVKGKIHYLCLLIICQTKNNHEI